MTLLLAGGGAGCGGGTPTRHPSAVEVRLSCATGDPDAPCAFRPAHVTIRVGGTVRWVNDDATYHTVTSTDRLRPRRPNGDFGAVLDAAGETFQRRFSEPGRYPYYCQPHAEFMVGTVTVVRR
ncbi:MAG: cupredoxin domain-containing protein [Micromonosporaceae bacterium]